MFDQRGRLTRLIAPEPFADGVAGAAELPCSGLKPVGTSKGNQLLMEPMTIGAHAIKFKVGAVHRQRMTRFDQEPFGPQLRRPRVPLALLGGQACELVLDKPSLPAPRPPVFGPR